MKTWARTLFYYTMSKEALLALRPSISPVVIRDVEGVYVRSMSGHDRNKLKALQARLEKEGKEAELDSYIVLTCACDDAGNLMFTDKDLPAVNQLPAHVLTAIAYEALKASALLPGDSSPKK